MASRTMTSGARACGRASRRTVATLASSLLLFHVVAGAAEPPQRPADMLARLVSPDMAMVVTVEGLRENTSDFLKSRLADDLWRLPAVRTWLGSEKLKDLDRARAQIETHLGVSLTDVRDELLGDAVILGLRLPREAPADARQARGILLVQARDPALLDRLIRAINKAQQDSGELAGVADLERNGVTYHVREFPAADGRPREWYVAYPDGTFAFSNSETMIQSVMDRKAVGRVGHDTVKAGSKDDPSLAELPRLKAVRGKLPERALVRLFVDPRQVERLLAGAPRPSERSAARLMAMLARYLAAVDYAGAALTWSDESIAIRTVETLNPSRLDPGLRRWASDARRVDHTIFESVPSTALALASGHVQALALLEALTQIVPEEDQTRLTNIETLLSGLLLGQDLRTKILPLVGPSILAYFDAPSEADGPAKVPEPKPTSAASWPFPTVVVISLGTTSEPLVSLAGIPSITTALAAIDNAMRTVLAMVAMDETRAQGRSRLTTRVVAGTAVTTLDPAIPFAYAVDHVRHRVVLSTSPAAVARYLEHAAGAGSSFGRIRAAAFADATTYACVDFDALDRLVAGNRRRFVQTLAARQKRSTDEVDRDLSHALALAKLFRAGFITSRFEKDATAVYRSVGLIRHEPGGK